MSLALVKPNSWCHLFRRFSFAISSTHSAASYSDLPLKLQCSDAQHYEAQRASHVSTGSIQCACFVLSSGPSATASSTNCSITVLSSHKFVNFCLSALVNPLQTTPNIFVVVLIALIVPGTLSSVSWRIGTSHRWSTSLFLALSNLTLQDLNKRVHYHCSHHPS